MSAEDAESYLRRFAEGQLRRLGAGEATAAECAYRVDTVAAAFERAGLLGSEVAEAVTDGLGVALAARSPERDTPLHRGRRAQVSALRGETGFARLLASPRGRPGPARREGPLGRPGRSDGGSAGGRTEREDPAGEVSATRAGTAVMPAGIAVTPVGTVLRPRAEGADEDVYLLAYVTAPGRAWLTVVARTTGPRLPRRPASPPSARNPRVRPAAGRPSSFAGGGMTAVDDAGRTYDLSFSGGGGQSSPWGGSPSSPGVDGPYSTRSGSPISPAGDRQWSTRGGGRSPQGGERWHLGRLSVNPAPLADIGWLEVRCGGESVRLDLTARGPEAEVTVRSLTHSPGEAFLLRRGESLLGSPDARPELGSPGSPDGRPGPASRESAALAEVASLAVAVPALRAVGVLPDGSPVPGQLAALAERLGAPGRLIAEPGELPARWAAALDAADSPSAAATGLVGREVGPAADRDRTVAAARLAAVLPDADGVTVWLAGLVTLPGEGTVLFGGLRVSGPRSRPCPEPTHSPESNHSPEFTSSSGFIHSPRFTNASRFTYSSGFTLGMRDDSGGWHAVSLRGWSGGGGDYAFQASVVPSVAPGTASAEFRVTGTATEVRAVVPLTWWSA